MGIYYFMSPRIELFPINLVKFDMGYRVGGRDFRAEARFLNDFYSEAAMRVVSH